MVFPVIGNVASLAPGAEVGGVAVFGLVVEMGDGEHDSAAGDGMGFVVAGATVGIGGAAFAAMAGPVEDGAADFPPVFRIARPVLDRHGADSGILFSVMMFPLSNVNDQPATTRRKEPPRGGFLLGRVHSGTSSARRGRGGSS